jgi:AraC family transcriptional regulator
MTATTTRRQSPSDERAAAARGLPGAALRRVLEYIDADCHRVPRLSELSALARMSAFHFARLFKQSAGVSPHRFVVGRRIDQAKVLLATEGASIAAVARAVGFRTPSHFTTVFRRTTGATPSAYRSTARRCSRESRAPAAAGCGPSIQPDTDVDPSRRTT